MSDYSTPRVHRHRGHADDDHSACRYDGCGEHRRLWHANRRKLEALCVFRKLHERGIEPRVFFGEHYGAAVELASAGFPDYDYLDAKPDRLDYLAAVPEEFRKSLAEGFDEPEPEDDFDYDAFFDAAEQEL